MTTPTEGDIFTDLKIKQIKITPDTPGSLKE